MGNFQFAGTNATPAQQQRLYLEQQARFGGSNPIGGFGASAGLTTALVNGVLFGTDTTGQTERSINELAKQRGISFEEARVLAPKLGVANAKQTTDFDYSRRNVRETELHRSRIEATEDDANVGNGRTHLRKAMKCEHGDDLDSKRCKFKFTNMWDLTIALVTAMERLLRMNMNIMSKDDIIRYNLQCRQVTRMILLDCGRIQNPEVLEPLFQSFIDVIFDPQFGVTVEKTNKYKNGKQVAYVRVDKDLISQYKYCVRNHLEKFNKYEKIRVGKYSICGACIYYNLHVKGGSVRKCEFKDDSEHGILSHWCLRCGPDGKHPEVCCHTLRQTFKPVKKDPTVIEPKEERPDCTGTRITYGNGRGGSRGGRGRRRPRGGGRGGRSNMGDRTPGNGGTRGDSSVAKENDKKATKKA